MARIVYRVSNDTPEADSGAGDPGSSAALSRGDHVHPAGGGVALSDNDPADVAVTADAGAGTEASRDDHAHEHGDLDVDSDPAALHHTIGSGANQAAAGNHSHAASGIATHDDAWASPPASPNEGDLWLPPDAPYAARYDGAAWAPRGPIFPLTDPALAGLSTWVNQGTASLDTSHGGLTILAPADAGNEFRVRVKATPATPFTVTICLLCQLINSNYNSAGLFLRQSSDGKLIFCGLGQTGNILIQQHSGPSNNFSSEQANLTFPHGPRFLRYADNGTNRSWHASNDGRNFMQLLSEGRTTYLTADQIGFGVNGPLSTYTASITLLSWTEA